MNLLNKLTIKNLKLNKKRTIVTIIGIILSVSLLTTVSSMYESGIKSLIKFEIYQRGNYHVGFLDVPKSEINTFKNNRTINTISMVNNIGYASIDSKNKDKPYAYIKEYDKNALNNLSLKLIDGRLPKNNKEILIPSHLKTNGRLFYSVGDTITLNIGTRVDKDNDLLYQYNPYQIDNEKIINTKEYTYKIVGIIERPDTNIEEYTAPGYTFISYNNDINSSIVDLYIRYNDNSIKNWYINTANILGINSTLYKKINSNEELSKFEYEKVYSELEKAKYQTNVNTYLIGLETNPIGESGISGLAATLIIVLLIIVVTSVFCIKNSFDISISEKIKQYGMLRSIGATKKQIRKNVFYEASILGLIGIPLGILFGLLASRILVVVSNYYLEDSLTNGLKLVYSFSILSIIISILLGVITIYLSQFKSARKASKISLIDSIRNSNNIKINSKKIKSSKLINKLFGIGGVISIKNIKRNKRKYRTTIISIIVSVFTFIGLSSFMNYAFDTLDNQINRSEYNVSLYTNALNDVVDKYMETTKLDNIKECTFLRYTGLDINNYKYNKEFLKWNNEEDINNNEYVYTPIYSLGNKEYNRFIKSLKLDYNYIKDKAILVDYSNFTKYNSKTNKVENKYMRITNYKENDIIKGNLMNKDSYELEIGYITKERPFGMKDINGDFLIVSEELYSNIEYSDTLGQLNIYYNSNNPDKLQNDIDELLKGESYKLYNINEEVMVMNNLFILIGIFLYGFIIVISLIGITNIFNTITTNMELRRQEFAMLKSIGITNKEFNRMIRLESLFIGLKSLLYGIFIGIVISYIIYHYLSIDNPIKYRLPILAIIISILVVFMLIFLIMKYSLSKISKQNLIETIRNENI